ncbi:MAG: phenylalanine--tRNA ligase subunit beta [Alphaproteobacteria bacterium]|nr:phenylalanine--tRNA ligase subunit beta [Alphaproteobacteria bacterium]
MKFTLSWLKQHLDTDASLEVICEKLTAIGLEVEKVTDPGKSLAPFIIAHVLTAEKHPQADRLKVTTVDTGKEKLQIVCGAPNCRAGMKAVLARPGDVMPDSGEALKKGVIRGVESQGMLCGADELKIPEEPGLEPRSIVELPADAPIGESYARYAKLDDPVIEINLTPNRPDCAGVYGIARDLAATGIGKLKPLDIQPVKGTFKTPIKMTLDLPTNDKDACPLITGKHIRNIKNGPSPKWVQERLRAIGLRPISAVVDITNLVSYGYARPLHAFDAAKLKGNLRVHLAKGGEELTLLNGKTYTLQAGMTVISDDTGPLELSAIMGGESTSCESDTKDIYIISAYFDPARTAKTGRALGIHSDARYRFERGIDPQFTIPGAELATQLVLDFCGTQETIVSDLEIAGAVPSVEKTITLDAGKCRRHLGVDVQEKEQQAILVSLGFQVKAQAGKLTVQTPSWRPDIEGAADLVEEIIRIKGYEHIHATPVDHPHVTSVAIDVQDGRSHAARRALAGQGLLEAVTWSFMPHAVAEQFGAVDKNIRLSNPISSDLDVMRPSIMGNLVMAAKRNADRGFADVGLYEVGPVYKNATPEGQDIVAAALRAGATPRNWAAPSRPVDAYDAKADVLAALAACGAPVNSLQITEDAPGWYHPGRSGCLRLGPALLAVFGEIHPTLLAACDAEGPMVGCEIFLSAIPQSRASGSARPLLKLEALQSVARDFAFVVDRHVTAAKLIKAVRDADKNLIRDVAVFDVYEGKNIDADKKSVALSVTLQPTDKTLTDAEIEALSAKITAGAMKATGAVLRK